MVREGLICEKNLRLLGREFHRRGEELWKEQLENLYLELSGKRERQRWSDE